MLMKIEFRAVLLALLPVPLVRLLSSRLRASIHPSAHVGFSYIAAKDLNMGSGTSIGHLNWITVDKLDLSDGASVGHMNQIAGRIIAILNSEAAIGNRNIISRSRQNSSAPSLISLGVASKITAGHKVNLASNFSLGDYSIIAGCGSQIWTHGYVHDEKGRGRYRIDGDVKIGNNVYVGSMCFFSMGVYVGDGVIIGGGTSVAKDLTDPGLYVSSPIRKLPRPLHPNMRVDLEIIGESAGDVIYKKRRVDKPAFDEISEKD